MTRLLHFSLALASVLCLAACGGPDIGAVVGSGDVVRRSADGEAAATGPVPFGNGDRFVANDAAVVRVTCGGALHDRSSADGRPDAGLADLHLDAGTEVKRREGSAFDLVSGSMRLHAGPMKARVVFFHGTTFLEVPTRNAKGVDLRASTDGDALTIAVTKGEVLLHSTGATEKELHFVTLGPGEAATASPGSKPQKRAD
jgi:hypothetical protein